MKISRYLSVFAIAAILSSCSQEGPAGPQGATGPAGANGTNGTNGVSDATAVTYSVTTADWSNVTSTTFIATFTESNIIDANNDAIEVYWSTSSANSWLSLPAQSILNTGDFLSYGFTNGNVTFQYYTGGPTTAPTTTLYFNVVVIPPSIMVKNQNINWANPSEALQVPEVISALKHARSK